eukprot:scaffold27859_cov109-Isochrysis_galbana.AAC.2
MGGGWAAVERRTWERGGRGSGMGNCGEKDTSNGRGTMSGCAGEGGGRGDSNEGRGEGNGARWGRGIGGSTAP